MVEFWEDAHELASLVGASLSSAIARNTRVGWVRGDQVVSMEALGNVVYTGLISYVEQLTRRVAELESRLSSGTWPAKTEPGTGTESA
jgi:hypothetical protein